MVAEASENSLRQLRAAQKDYTREALQWLLDDG
ncbi:hypothetical protein [Salmonella enterica]|nr:hypothetical protein [Salmonella enterica]